MHISNLFRVIAPTVHTDNTNNAIIDIHMSPVCYRWSLARNLYIVSCLNTEQRQRLCAWDRANVAPWNLASDAPYRTHEEKEGDMSCNSGDVVDPWLLITPTVAE
jgi:hypothetical protein